MVACIVQLSSCGDEDFYDDQINHELEPEPEPEQKITQTTRLSEWQIAQHLLAAGFKNHEVYTMICIAKYESAFRRDAVGHAARGRARGSRDIGLFQINAYYWARPLSKGGCGVNERQLFDPAVNARCARVVFERHGYEGWVAYKKNRSICQNYLAFQSKFLMPPKKLG